LAKKRKEQPRREFTKRQLSQWQRQKRVQRITIIAGISVLVAILGIVLGGLYVTEVGPLHETVIKVNDTEFNMDYYVKMLQFYATNSTAQFSLEQVVQSIERDEIVRQGATKLGISVSDDEVNQELKNYGLPQSQEYRDMVRVQLLATKLRDEYFSQQVPASAEQRHVLAMLLESANQAAEVEAALKAGGDFATLAGEVSLESLSKTDKGDLGWHPQDALSIILGTAVPGDYAFNATEGALSQPLDDKEMTKNNGYWLIRPLGKNDDGTSDVCVILLGSKEEAESVRARIDAGEDFSTLATDLSQDENSKQNNG
jgi:parvulin-like peptidyl-prolyl isomerase